MKQQEPIAIVGLSGLFPGSVDVAAFWNNILRGVDLITDVPADSHWSVADYFDVDANKRAASAPDKTYAKRGGFLPKVPFETLKEGIPPSLLSSTDTSQLLSLLVARTALEECFMGPIDKADRSKVSCILGVTSGQELFGQMAGRLAWPQWIAGMRAAGIDEEAAQKAADEIAKTFTPWSEASFPGLLGNVVAGRIANRLDLGGSNAVTDAACASSFAAVSMGVDELLLGRADVVLTGGVDTLNDIFMHMCFTKTPALSAAGDCRPFDQKADGTLLGEGLGMLALKRLSDAERDGNVIYALIKGIGTSSDGKSKSVYAPVSEGQAKALVRAYQCAGYTPATVELVEAHGTGTKAGDVAELGGLRLAFDDAQWKRDDRQYCAVGSVKSQIGHTKSAAGAAGLVKAALALHEKVLPPTIKVDTPNPGADFPTSPFYVNTQRRPWFRGSAHPRRAGVSSFGFGGSNWHITLEEYVGANKALPLARRDVEVLALSASSKEMLSQRAKALMQSASQAHDLAAFCQDINAAFNIDAAHRVAFTVSSFDEVKKRLEQVSAGAAVPGLFFGEGKAPSKVAFVFPGQGSQTVGMGQALALAFPEARAAWDAAVDTVPEVVRTAHPPPSFSDDEKKLQQARLTQTEVAQPALGVASMAALRVLRSLNVPMDLAAGHSFGELSALCAAGVFDEASLYALARRRGELMKASATVPGAMAAVIGDASKIPAVLSSFGSKVVIANQNAPDQTVISGEADAVKAAAKSLEAAGLKVKMLPVSTAFHSPLVEAACAPLRAALDATTMQAPSVPVFANVSAKAHGDVAAIRQSLSEQVRASVRFVDEVNAMIDAGADCFVEVGAGSVLTGLIGRINKNVTAVAVDPGQGLQGVFTALARLCAAGVRVDLDKLPRQRPLPAPVAPSKAAVMVNGANVGRPALPAPAPVVRAPVAAPVSAAVPPVSSVSSITSQVSQLSKQPQLSSRPARGASQPASQPVKVTTMTTPKAPPSGWLQVFQEGQQQTMEAHLAFQKALADAHNAYLTAYESTSSQLISVLGGGAPVVRMAPVVTAPVMTAPVVAPVMTAAPAIAAPAPVVARPAPTPVAAPVVAPVPAPAPVAAKAAGNVDGRAALFAVVADKTGYPVSALEDAMHLESDLGIDSIKRVEILGALKETVPQAASLDALKLAQLATLGEIAAALAGVTGAASAPAAVAASAPAAPAPATNGAAVDGRAALFAVVADKTGYPVSALEDTMHLESDLGIDSIKRVEILGALKDTVPAAATLDALKLSQLATLGEIAQALASVSGGSATNGVKEGTPPHPTVEATTCPRAVVRLVAAPTTQQSLPPSPVVVVAKGPRALALADGLIQHLADHGVKATIAQGVFPDTATLIDLTAIDALGDGVDALSDGLFRLQQAGASLRARNGRAIFVNAAGGVFAGTHAISAQGLSGLAKTARQEWPEVDVRYIDVDIDDSGVAAALAHECVTSGTVEVGVGHGQRVLPAVLSAPIETNASSKLQKGDVVVISGGARGVTATCALALATAVPGLKLALLQRTVPAPEPFFARDCTDEGALKRAILADAAARGESVPLREVAVRAQNIIAAREVQSTLSALRRFGDAELFSCDVQRDDSVAAALDAVRARFGAINVVVHGAGVLADKRIEDKKPEQLDRVIGTKVSGLASLLRHTSDDPLRAIVAFSSVAGRFGNVGQVDYSMANEAMTRMLTAERARRPHTIVKSLHWGPWEGGMVTPELKAQFAQRGITVIDRDDGARAFVEELSQVASDDVEIVLGASLASGAGAGVSSSTSTTVVSHETMPWLADHAVKGEVVLPVAVALDLMVQGASSLGAVVALSSVEVVKGQRLPRYATSGHQAKVSAVRNDKGAIAVELHVDGTLAYRAQASVDVAQSVTSPAALQSTLSQATFSQPLYAGSGGPGLLFHGPRFHLIERLDGASDEAMAAQVVSTRAAGFSGVFASDVAAVDAGLQLLLLWARHKTGGAFLPTRVGGFWQRSAVLTSPDVGNLVCVLQAKQQLGRDDVRATADLHFTDARGTPVFSMTDVVAHRLPDDDAFGAVADAELITAPAGAAE